jgi:hypothetical protein
VSVCAWRVPGCGPDDGSVVSSADLDPVRRGAEPSTACTPAGRASAGRLGSSLEARCSTDHPRSASQSVDNGADRERRPRACLVIDLARTPSARCAVRDPIQVGAGIRVPLGTRCETCLRSELETRVTNGVRRKIRGQTTVSRSKRVALIFRTADRASPKPQQVVVLAGEEVFEPSISLSRDKTPNQAEFSPA